MKTLNKYNNYETALSQLLMMRHCICCCSKDRLDFLCLADKQRAIPDVLIVLWPMLQTSLLFGLAVAFFFFFNL